MKISPRLFFPAPAFVRLAAVLIFAGQAHSQITVTTLADENDNPAGPQVSLREAIRDSANGGQITFDAALSGKVLILTSGEMALTKTLTVRAPSGGLIIEARERSRIFRVMTGAGLNLTDLTLQGGFASTDGGAIQNAGTLNLTNCILRDNKVATGVEGSPGSPVLGGGSVGTGGIGGTGGSGGAVSSSGSLSATGSHFIGNTAGAGGSGGRGGDVPQGMAWDRGGSGGQGGIGGSGGAILSTGSLHLTECLFENNWAGYGGRAGARGSPSNKAYSSHGGRAGSGGAVHQTGSMLVQRCTFTGNVCPPGGIQELNTTPGAGTSFGGDAGKGAAIYWSSGSATLTNCTLTGNRIGESGHQVENGGAFAAGTGSELRLVHCTVAANIASNFYQPNILPIGSPAWFLPPTADVLSTFVVRCENCIISGFSANSPRTIFPFGFQNGMPGSSSLLGPPVITSGSLPVLIPDPASAAIDAGALLNNPPVTDARGLLRVAGPPDLGAVEVQPAEAPTLTPQSITFTPPVMAQTTALSLTAKSSSSLPVSLELISGPAALNNNVLTFSGHGFAVIRAAQAGNATTAPAPSVVRVVQSPHSILFAPAANYTAYEQMPAVVLLPATTTADLAVTWTFATNPPAGISLIENRVTATAGGTVQVRGQNAGNTQSAPVDLTWTLTFVMGTLNISWVTPVAPAPGAPLWFTLVEGSPHRLQLTARISAAFNAPVPVPSLPAGIIAVPSLIPAGVTEVQCLLTLPANSQLVNTTAELETALSGQKSTTTLFLANRKSVPLNVFAPSTVAAGTTAQVDVFAPGVIAGQQNGPPPDLSVRTLAVSAVDFDNPALAVPVTLDSFSTDPGAFPRKHLQVTFPSENRRLRLTVITDDGISGTAGPIQITGGTVADTNADRDGINDIVETALQRTPGQFDQPPLTIERDATGLKAILASRPSNLLGWTVSIETSTDLQTWIAAPAASTTVSANPDGTTERVSVLLPADGEPHFVRLKAVKP